LRCQFSTDADDGRQELNALKGGNILLALNQAGVVDGGGAGKFMNSWTAPFETLLDFEIPNYLCLTPFPWQ